MLLIRLKLNASWFKKSLILSCILAYFLWLYTHWEKSTSLNRCLQPIKYFLYLKKNQLNELQLLFQHLSKLFERRLMVWVWPFICLFYRLKQLTRSQNMFLNWGWLGKATVWFKIHSWLIPSVSFISFNLFDCIPYLRLCSKRIGLAQLLIFLTLGSKPSFLGFLQDYGTSIKCFSTRVMLHDEEPYCYISLCFSQLFSAKCSEVSLPQEVECVDKK